MINLTLNETRVLGVLFEKERTTPDQYPLSLNALTNGCNQKSNREPVLTLSEVEVQTEVDSLIDKGLVAEVVVGSRVKKYRQRFANTEFSELTLSLKEQSIISVLFLRGPQTPGELRARTNRLCDFDGVDEVERVLQVLVDRPGNAYVKKLTREPGKRESRYLHLFSGELVTLEAEAEVSSVGLEEINGPKSEQAYTTIDPLNHSQTIERVRALEQKVTYMQAEIDTLKRLWDDLNQ